MIATADTFTSSAALKPGDPELRALTVGVPLASPPEPDYLCRGATGREPMPIGAADLLERTLQIAILKALLAE